MVKGVVISTLSIDEPTKTLGVLDEDFQEECRSHFLSSATYCPLNLVQYWAAHKKVLRGTRDLEEARHRSRSLAEMFQQIHESCFPHVGFSAVF